MKRVSILVMLVLVGCPRGAWMPSIAQSHPSFNSTEPGCGTADPNVLMCDDFEDGNWYVTNCDSEGGPLNPGNDGWCGSVYTGINPDGAAFAVCGNQGAAGTNCAADGGDHSGAPGGGHTAQHGFYGVDEIYIRWYYKASPGYQWGWERSINPTWAGTGAYWGDIQFNCGATERSFAAVPYIAEVGPSGICQGTNVPDKSITIYSGRWYFFEYYIKLSSPEKSDGIFKLWIDDCTCGCAQAHRRYGRK